MKNSNTCRDEQFTCPCLLPWLMAVCAVLFAGGAAHALDPSRAVSQYVHDRWEADRGFIGGAVYAIGQSEDGYLWIGTERGLVRFDGFQFTLIQRPQPDSAPIGPVRGLTSDAEGNLWIRLAGPHLLRYRKGRFEDIHNSFDLQDMTFTAAANVGAKGVLFSGLGERMLRYRNGKFETVLSAADNPGTVISMAQTRDGRIWLGTRDNGLFRVKDEHIQKVADELGLAKISALAPASSGGLWVGTEHGIRFWDGRGLVPLHLPPSIADLPILAMVRDLDGNIWAGTNRGVVRITAFGEVSLDQLNAKPGYEVGSIFEDRDGDIWLGSSRGIERLRNGMFATYSTSDGLPSDSNGPVYADSDGRTWFAPLSGGLYWMKHNQVHRVTLNGLDRDVVYSISGGEGEVWVGRQRGGLTKLTGSGNSLSARSYTRADGLAQDSVYSVHRSRDGTVWAGTVSAGVSRLASGRFTNFSEADGLPSNTINAIEEGADGSTWLATPAGVAAFVHGHWSRQSKRDGLSQANVRTIFQDSRQVLWVGTQSGLAYLASGRVETPPRLPELLREQIFGIAEDKMGSLWIATSDHILQVNRDRLMEGSVEETDVQSYGIGDGLEGVEGVARDRTVVSDPQGRIWVSLNHGLSVADPRVTATSELPVSVRIESMTAGGNPVDWRNPKPIAAGVQSLIFEFAGSNLATPDRVRFRYRLEGTDQGWSDIIASRQVVYRNLGPGPYRFRIVASDASGLWNGPDTLVPFVIEPAFWQTLWFRGVLLAAFALTVLGLYRLRMYQITQELNIRFQERLAERSRIAQDLHDTLLQGVLSASLQLDVVEDRLPQDSAAKAPLQRILQLMSKVIEEGRDALRGLRSSESDSRSLELAFSRMRQEFALDDRIVYRVIVHSIVRPLRPLIRDEVYRIGREALVNAFVHARAGTIEVDLDYASRHLTVAVRDDGVGIDPQVLQAGKDGHLGLPGMRSRAEGIGASLKLRSRLGAGTEVELTVPSAIAFEDHARGPLARWLPWFNRETFRFSASRREKRVKK